MTNDLIHQKNWFQRNWKWALPVSVVAILAVTLFFSLTAGHLDDFGKAYAEPQLYDGAVEIAQQNSTVNELLGKIEPVTKMAILEGDIDYTNQNKNVHFSVRIESKEGKARMSVDAERNSDFWEYRKIIIRIKNPSEKRQTILVK